MTRKTQKGKTRSDTSNANTQKCDNDNAPIKPRNRDNYNNDKLDK